MDISSVKFGFRKWLIPTSAVKAIPILYSRNRVFCAAGFQLLVGLVDLFSAGCCRLAHPGRVNWLSHWPSSVRKLTCPLSPARVLEPRSQLSTLPRPLSHSCFDQRLSPNNETANYIAFSLSLSFNNTDTPLVFPVIYLCSLCSEH